MKKFSDLGIKAETRGFIGNKIDIYDVLNRPIVLVAYRIEKSKFVDKGCGSCLWMQIKVNDDFRVLFSGSRNLMDMIQKIRIDDMPVETTIVKDGKTLIFT